MKTNFQFCTANGQTVKDYELYFFKCNKPANLNLKGFLFTGYDKTTALTTDVMKKTGGFAEIGNVNKLINTSTELRSCHMVVRAQKIQVPFIIRNNSSNIIFVFLSIDLREIPLKLR